MNIFTDPRQQFSEGFTLIEAIIFVLILGIVATLALPTLQSGLAESKLAGASGEITVALEYAQLAAMTSGGQTRVTINAEEDTIRVESFKISVDITGTETQFSATQIENGAFATVPHPAKRGLNYYIVFADEARFDGVDIVSATFTVIFGAMGVPSTGGTVMLSLGSKQVSLTVDSLTGKVTSSG
jgi:type II secretory pathway pseudopilin PulG